MRIVQVLLSLLMLVITSTAYASHWQYLGHGKLNVAEEYAFLDADSLIYTDNKNVRVWVESISENNLIAYFDKHKPEMAEQEKIFLSSGYVPKALELEATKKQDKTNYKVTETAAAIYEYEANTYHLPISTKMYFEIDCNEKRMRTLELINFDENGNIRKRAGIQGEWQFIAPDSNAEILSMLFCKGNP